MDDDMRRGGGFASSFFGPDSFGFFRRNYGKDNNNNNSSRDPFDSFLINDFGRIFQEVDDMMRNFSFGMNMIQGHDENGAFENPAIQNVPPKQNLRDHFLNEKDESKNLPPTRHSLFDRLFNPRSLDNKENHNVYHLDEDLDVKLEREGLDKVAREDLFLNKSHTGFNMPAPQQHQHPSFFSAQSYSIRRVQRPDGSIEEVKTLKNADGKEEKTITRIIGDKAHSVTEKKVNNQLQETEETFHNFDENKIEEFNKMWNHNHHNHHHHHHHNHHQHHPNFNNSPMLESENSNNKTIQPVIDSDKKSSLVSKLFSWFKK